MGISNIQGDFANEARRACNKFSNHNIPFSAIRVNLPKKTDTAEAEKTFLKDIRKTDKIAINDNGSYTVLLHNTPADDAITVYNRLASRLYALSMKYGKDTAKQISFDMIGTKAGSTDIYTASFDLTDKNRKAPYPRPAGISVKYHTYIRHSNLATDTKGRESCLDIKV